MKIKKSIVAVLLSVLMMSSFCMETLAASQQESGIIKVMQAENEVVRLNAEVIGYNQLPEIVPYATTFVDASITISFDSEGMHIGICTGMNGIASVVGVKNIEVHRKRLIGWELVAVSDGGEAYGVTTGLCSLVYTGAVEGEQYRVSCTHYGDVDGYREMDHQTDWVTCNF